MVFLIVVANGYDRPKTMTLHATNILGWREVPVSWVAFKCCLLLKKLESANKGQVSGRNIQRMLIFLRGK